MKPQATDRTISYALYAALWLILVILQTLLTPLLSPEEVSVFTQPSLYYSTWLTDLYLVLIFYLNYYIFAPQLMRRRLFRSYLWLLVITALLGLMIPILCYSVWGLTMPGFAPNAVPISSLGVIGAVAVIMIGLAVRGLLEWDALGVENGELKEEILRLKTQMEGERKASPTPSIMDDTAPLTPTTHHPHEEGL